MLKSTLDFIFKTGRTISDVSFKSGAGNNVVDTAEDDVIEIMGGSLIEPFRISLLWDNASDLDLKVTNPNSEILSKTNTETSDKGMFEVESDNASYQIEHCIFKETESLLNGSYNISVNENVKRTTGDTTFKLKIVIGNLEYVYDGIYTSNTPLIKVSVLNGSMLLSFTHTTLKLTYANDTSNDPKPISSVSKNDSPSDILKNPNTIIEDEIKEKGAIVFKGYSLNDLALQEYSVESSSELIENLQYKMNEQIQDINSLIRTELIELRSKLDECKSKVKQALVAEKKLVGETYTAVIPISEEYTTPHTSATIKDGVILGAGYNLEKEVENVLELDTLNIVGEESTKFKISSRSKTYPLVISLNKNLQNTYNQIRIILPPITQAGILLIKFDKTEAVSVLDKDGYEIVPKHIKDSISFPVDSSSNSFSIRFLDNSQRDLKVNSMYFTEAIYNTETVYETLPITINKDLSFITVESCDNYASKDVDILYEISLNGEDYEEYRPSGKLKNKLVQSIIATDKLGYNEPIVLENPERGEGVFKFYPSTPIAQSSRLKAFCIKLGVDVLSLEAFLEPKGATGFLMHELNNDDRFVNLETRKLTFLYAEDRSTSEFITTHIVLKETFDFYINEGQEIILDGIKYKYDDTEGGVVVFTKGLHKLQFKREDWKELVDLGEYEIVGLDSETLYVINRSTGEKVGLEFYFNPKQKQYNSFFLQLWLQKTDIYLFEDIVKRRYSESYLEYFYKDNPYKVYLLNENPSRLITTIQIRATMKSINEVVCPYISKLIIRGI